MLGAAKVMDGMSVMTGKTFFYGYDKYKEIMAPGWVSSPKKAQEDFGFSAKTEFLTGLQTTLDWYHQQGWM